MLLDTDVLLSQVRKRKEDMQKKPPPPPPRKLPTKGKEYRTVAASVGVSYYCTWIPIRRGVRYRLGVDARCEGRQRAVKVFVKGYIEDPRRPPEFRRRVAYKKYLSCRATPVWQRFSCEFSPTARTEKVRWIRVMLFSAWPPGVTYFDNVAVREVRATPKGNVPR